MTANELAEAMEIRASIRRKATSRKSVTEGANDRLADQLDQAATMLRQQQAEIEALKDFAIWLTGCGYDFCQHEYFIKCRDELLIGKAQEK